jgi:GntP family gluconate:H+ symporter
MTGIPVTAVVTLSGYLVSRRRTRREYPMDPVVRAEVYGEPVTDEAAPAPPPAAPRTPTATVTAPPS